MSLSVPRRRIVRPALPVPSPRAQPVRQVHKLRSKLEAERAALARWMPRRKRAGNTVWKLQQRVARLEKQLASLTWYACCAPVQNTPSLRFGGTLMSRVIEVTVSPTGETSIQTKGYAGSDCLQASKFLEQSLGVISSEHRTAEYFESTTEQQQVQQ